jgi:hypothetical protein
MGFTFRCSSGELYTVRFSNDTRPQVIQITPSTCSLVEFVYFDANGVIRSSKPAPANLMQNVAFGAAKAYYLGDFFATVMQTPVGYMTHWDFKINRAKNDYEATTADMRAAFPGLSAMPTENRMLVK